MKRISVDMGSGVTKIYMSGCGVVLAEATCVAVEEGIEKGESYVNVKAYGDKARALYGRAAVNTHIVNPVLEGDIVNERLAAELLGYFLEKIGIPYKKAKRVEAVFILPCGAKPELKQKYMDVAEDCGLQSVYFTVTPFAAILGHNVAINESKPMFLLDIGQSITNIAALSQDGIIYGLTVNLGGANIDVHLIDELAENYELKIGALTAERLKNTVGSLVKDDYKMSIVEGRDVTTGSPASIAVNSEQIYGVVVTYIDKILEYVALVLTKLPAEVASAIMRGGIYLTGGVMRLDGIGAYIEEKLGIAVNETEEPQYAAVTGGGTILTNDSLFDRLTVVE